jgi:hypothetical protein
MSFTTSQRVSIISISVPLSLTTRLLLLMFLCNPGVSPAGVVPGSAGITLEGLNFWSGDFTYGITRDVIHHQSKGLDHIHQRAPVFDNKVEHLWVMYSVVNGPIAFETSFAPWEIDMI